MFEGYVFKVGKEYLTVQDWSDDPMMARHYTDAAKFDSEIEAEQWLKNNFPLAQLFKVEIFLTEVERVFRYSTLEEKKKEALAKLSEEEKILLGLL